jgi:phosphoribosyl-AMP cyclohydrolase
VATMWSTIAVAKGRDVEASRMQGVQSLGTGTSLGACVSVSMYACGWVSSTTATQWTTSRKAVYWSREPRKWPSGTHCGTQARQKEGIQTPLAKSITRL